MILCAATGNPGKLAELRRILEAMGHTVKSQRELGLALEPEETGLTFEENALIKARALCLAGGENGGSCLPTVADDSGLAVDILGGAPGVFSARYAGVHGDDAANNRKLLADLAGVPPAGRGAKFVSAVCLYMPDGRFLTVTGECPGAVGFEEVGTGGFGYDPIFIPAGMGGRSYAQLSDGEKDLISHRGKALAALAQALPAFLAGEQG